MMSFLNFFISLDLLRSADENEKLPILFERKEVVDPIDSQSLLSSKVSSFPSPLESPLSSAPCEEETDKSELGSQLSGTAKSQSEILTADSKETLKEEGDKPRVIQQKRSLRRFDISSPIGSPQASVNSPGMVSSSPRPHPPVASPTPIGEEARKG